MYRFVTASLILFSVITSKAQSRDTTITFYFNKNQYTITSEQKEQINLLMTQVLKIQKITGFADSTGSNAYNKELSRKRAFAIATLVSNQEYQPLIDFK
jgi:outer membrane protein OmpA-like peptidoglycan-associated protein